MIYLEEEDNENTVEIGGLELKYNIKLTLSEFLKQCKFILAFKCEESIFCLL